MDVLQRAGWVKRALFLADRVSLVNQAANAFKAHLPESSPVNLVTEKITEGRAYVCTYPTMVNLIDSGFGSAQPARRSMSGAEWGVGHFDLVIIDEAHRSVYQKYGAIFRYFDSLLVGLTATPREEVDKNTYELFELEPGVPTDAYELETAVADGFLVPPRVQQVDLKFPRDGIDYDSLSEEEKAQWESLDWGDNGTPGTVPERVNAAAINSWLFNKDTVDKVLQHLMEHGHKVEGGDRLCPQLFGSEEDKKDFRVFDFCFNFDFFRENPKGIEADTGVPLGTRLFRARVQLLGHLQDTPDLDPEDRLRGSLAQGLHREVAAMNRENFIVRLHLAPVERFQDSKVWENLSKHDREVLQREVAGLPNELEIDEIESRMFDLTALLMQLALAENDVATLEGGRQKVVEIAMLLEEKANIPAVKEQLGYLAAIQEQDFREGITLALLEEMRLRLRGLLPFLDKKKRTIVYTDFKDQVVGIREDQVVYMPKMTGVQYEKKVKEYLRSHLDHLVIHRLRSTAR